MFSTRRRRLFVDFKLQGVLLVHTAIYWFHCLLSVMLIAFCWIILVERPGTSGELLGVIGSNYVPVLLGSVLLLPLVLMDCLRVSNRLAGPMLRIHRSVKQLADGVPADPVHLREKDFWKEFSDDLNRLIARNDADRPPAPEACPAAARVEVAEMTDPDPEEIAASSRPSSAEFDIYAEIPV